MNTQKGSVLLEVLVLMILMSAIDIGGKDLLLQTIKAKHLLTNQVAQTEELNRVWMLVQNDVSQIIDRPVRNSAGGVEASLNVSGSQLAATKAGWDNSLHPDRSRLQRFQYKLVGSALLRTTWDQLDGAKTSNSQTVKFDGVTSFKVEVLNDDNTWSKTIQNVTKETMPLAVKVTIQMSGSKPFSRIFDLPFYEYPPKASES